MHRSRGDWRRAGGGFSGWCGAPATGWREGPSSTCRGRTTRCAICRRVSWSGRGAGAGGPAVGAAGGGARPRRNRRLPHPLRLEHVARELRPRRAHDRVATVRGAVDERRDDGGQPGRGAAAQDGSGLVRRDEVARELMEGQAGRKEREKVGELKQPAAQAVAAKDGSSCNALA
ncbi:hypothetical protein BHE74_00042147 [Ensete ventricosum]|nr:hypothetical protein BHE74_00042147 [Ensete ventricosum]